MFLENYIVKIQWVVGRVWLMAPVLKTDVGKTTGGSNPSLPAMELWLSGLKQQLAKL